MFEPDPGPRKQQRSRMTFSLAALMMLMFMCAVLSALLAGMMRHKGGSDYEYYVLAMYVLASVAAPMGVMIVISLFVHFRKRKRVPRKEEKSGTLND
jgi:hypothetical protein